MIQKTLSALAVLIVALWVLIATLEAPPHWSDPDGELLVFLLVALDMLLFLVGLALVAAKVRGAASGWIAVAVLAVPLMHWVGSVSAEPLNLVLFLFPAGVLPVIIAFKWKAIQQPHAEATSKTAPSAASEASDA